MTVLVVGAHGQLGQAITARLGRQHHVVACGRADLDIADQQAVLHAARHATPAAIVNCAAYNDVDGAESDPAPAFRANAWAVRHLARAALETGAILVHYGTDFVFDGASETPYTEDDPPHPRGVYATSKLVGEWFATEAPKHYVLRVESLFGGRAAKSTVDRMRTEILNGRPVRAFADRAVSPSYVVDVAEATCALIERNAPYGLYHCVNSGNTNWLALAHEIAGLVGRPDATIIGTKLKDAVLRAPRPLRAALSNAKLRRAGIEMPTWQDALVRYLSKLDV